jgi:hypothetical protein
MYHYKPNLFGDLIPVRTTAVAGPALPTASFRRAIRLALGRLRGALQRLGR